MTRQYIGARYVPQFYENPDTLDATWKSGVVYEPLTMVTYNSATYTSKKEVPQTVGDPASNPSYWVATGNYNGQIAYLQQQIGTLADLNTITKSSLVDAINEINLQRIVTPEQFGAIGDGVADDTAAVQAAVTVDAILLLNNEYLITNTITLPGNRIILGHGTIKADYTNGYFDNIELAGGTVINGITFTDTHTVYDETAHHVINGVNHNNISITNCIFNSCHVGHCIHLETCKDVSIKYNYILNYGYSAISLFTSCRRVDVEFNYIENCMFYSGSDAYGIVLSGYYTTEYGPARDIRCAYNYIDTNNGIGEGIDSHGIENCEVIANRVKGALRAITFTRPTGIGPLSVTNRNINVINNIVEATGTQAGGISFTSDSSTDIQNVVVKGNKITLSGQTIYTSITAGISLRTATEIRNVEITDNIIVTPKNGIQTDTYPLYNIIIKNNDISGAENNDVYCIDLVQPATFRNVEIKNNILHNAVRCFRGPNGNTLPDLIHMTENYMNNAAITNGALTTHPRSVLNPATKAAGMSGDFVPNTASGTVVGWYCLDTASWLEVSGTSV